MAGMAAGGSAHRGWHMCRGESGTLAAGGAGAAEADARLPLPCAPNRNCSQRLDDIADTFPFSAEDHEGLVKTCMTTLSSKM